MRFHACNPLFDVHQRTSVADLMRLRAQLREGVGLGRSPYGDTLPAASVHWELGSDGSLAQLAISFRFSSQQRCVYEFSQVWPELKRRHYGLRKKRSGRPVKFGQPIPWVHAEWADEWGEAVIGDMRRTLDQSITLTRLFVPGGSLRPVSASLDSLIT